MNEKLEKTLDEVKAEMAEKPAEAKPQQQEETAVSPKKKSTAKKKVVAKKSPAKVKKSNGVDENSISLATLASEAKITTSVARRKLRAAKIENESGRWTFKKDSRALAAARKALAGE